MKAAALLVVITLTATPVVAQEPAPIHASIARAAHESAATIDAADRLTVRRLQADARSSGRAWRSASPASTTSVLGLTVLRTEDSSTGNAPTGTYAACVAQKNSNPVYATNQCDALKGKNLKLLWGGVAFERRRRRADDPWVAHQRRAVANLDRALPPFALLIDLARARRMTCHVRLRVLMVLALLFAPAAASAQRATTGTVTGKIVDSSGAVLPGVTVSLHESRGARTVHRRHRRRRLLPRRQPAARHLRREGRALRLSERHPQGDRASQRRDRRRLHAERRVGVGDRDRHRRSADRRSRARGPVGEHQQQGAHRRCR